MTKDTALRLALEFISSISPAFICEASHHKKHEQHASNELCPHVAKQKQVYEAVKAALEAKDEPVAFKIYKPTPPRHATPNVRDAELPWVYDQDPSSGNVASMWVTPVKATPPQRKPLTDEEIKRIWESLPFCNGAWETFARAIEAAHGIKGEA